MSARRSRPSLTCLVLGLLAALAPTGRPAGAQSQSLAVSRTQDPNARGIVLPEPLREVGFDQRLGERLPLELAFSDSHGRAVRLGELLGERPIVLAPVYYGCPMLCPLVLDGVIRALRPLSFDPGNELDVVAVSFDPREGTQQAAATRDKVLHQYARPGTEGGFRFLTGAPDQVSALMAAIGFNYGYDETSGEYAHAGGIVVLTPEGEVSRYFFGVDYPPKELRLALVEASQNRIGSLADQIFLFCFRYDPTLGKYSAVVINMIKLGCVLTLVALGAFLAVMWRAEGRVEERAEEPQRA